MSGKNTGFRNEAIAVALFFVVATVSASLVMGGSLPAFGGGAIGSVGKFTARNLASAFGICSYLIPAGCAYFGIRIFFSQISRAQAAKDFVAAGGVVLSCCLLAAVALKGSFAGYLSEHGAGGNLGGFLLGLAKNYFGLFGSYLIALSVMAVCLTFLSRASLKNLFSAVFKVWAKLLRAALSVLLKAGRIFLSRFFAAAKSAFYLAVKFFKDRAKNREANQKPVIRKEPDNVVEISAARQKQAKDKTPKITVPKNEREKTGTADKPAEGEFSEGRKFKLPPLELLDRPLETKTEIDREAAYRNAKVIEEKLEDFGVSGKVTEIKPGPVITMFEYKPAPGVRVSRVAALENDLAMSLSALSIRIISPIPGRDVIGIEVPNAVSETVRLRQIIESPQFSQSPSRLTIAVGKDISGSPYCANLATAPHLMIAGTTGSGKSVLLNSLLASLFYKSGPDRLRLLMIDPKMLEFAIYENIPHLLHPIVTEPRKAIAALKWAVAEMENRYRILSEKNVRNIHSYNAKIESEHAADSAASVKVLPYIVILIDELADLIMSAASETRETIIRIAQKARAAGIHLVVATQRPSADVVSGLLKANIPARISFLVSSKVDSRIVLDAHGAERLLGKGDMLFLKPGTSALERIQGALITDAEREKIVDFLKSQGAPKFSEEATEAINKPQQTENGSEEETDEIYGEAIAIVTEAGQVSISMLQRRLKIGYNRAATIVERMEKEGIVGQHQGAGKPREVILPEGE